MPGWLPANVNVASPDPTVPAGPPVMSTSGCADGENPMSSTLTRNRDVPISTFLIDGLPSGDRNTIGAHVPSGTVRCACVTTAPFASRATATMFEGAVVGVGRGIAKAATTAWPDVNVSSNGWQESKTYRGPKLPPGDAITPHASLSATITSVRPP